METKERKCKFDHEDCEQKEDKISQVTENNTPENTDTSKDGDLAPKATSQTIVMVFFMRMVIAIMGRAPGNTFGIPHQLLQ